MWKLLYNQVNNLLFQGWRNGMIGPTFPDLRIIIDKDLSTASWLFTAKSLGY